VADNGAGAGAPAEPVASRTTQPHGRGRGTANGADTAAWRAMDRGFSDFLMVLEFA
jgi:hypothetical protein